MEIRTQVIEINKKCPNCESGIMELVKYSKTWSFYMKFIDNKEQIKYEQSNYYTHKCNICKYEDAYEKKYPYIDRNEV